MHTVININHLIIEVVNLHGRGVGTLEMNVYKRTITFACAPATCTQNYFQKQMVSHFNIIQRCSTKSSNYGTSYLQNTAWVQYSSVAENQHKNL